MELTAKQLEDLKTVYDIQSNKGNWDYDPYMHGLFNGMEMMISIIENREPKFRKAPKKWLADIPMPENNSAEQGILPKKG